MIVKCGVRGFICLISINAYADFDLCNVSATQPMSVAWAYQTGALVKSSYSVGGWKHIGPSRCERLASGDVANNAIWIHAVSKGVILPPGQRSQGSRIWLTDQRFCIANEDFEYTGDGPGVTSECRAGHHLSTFPVSTWFGNDVADFRLEMNPDEFPASAGNASSASSGPALPDVHGALSISSSNMYYASMHYDSQDLARETALQHCRSSEPNANCTLSVDFKNRCLAVATNTYSYIQQGEPNWTEQETIDAAIKQCTEKDGPGCVKTLSACSTWVARSAQQNAHDAAAQEQIKNNMIEALQKIFQR